MSSPYRRFALLVPSPGVRALPTPPPLQIGLLNMMADGALKATERQFQRLLGGRGGPDDSTARAACVLHPFSFPRIPRGAQGRTYIADHYEDFATITRRGLDALIITGANIATAELEKQPFWQSLLDVMAWAESNVRSTLCSCLATHAVLEFRYGQRRRRMPEKLWGVYPHPVVAAGHPLVRGLAATVDVPHSRHNEITAAQFEAAGLKVLVAGPGGGAHLVVSADGPPCSLVMLQGHPEYDDVSLLKEYKREIARFVAGERADYPPLLEQTLDTSGEALCLDHRRQTLAALGNGGDRPDFPETGLLPHVRGTWHDAASRVVLNWVEALHTDEPGPG